MTQSKICPNCSGPLVSLGARTGSMPVVCSQCGARHTVDTLSGEIIPPVEVSEKVWMLTVVGIAIVAILLCKAIGLL